MTGTRADYGIMATIMKEVAAHPDVELQIVATNMHLSPVFGTTVNEIEADGFKVDVKIPSLAIGDSAEATVKSMAKVQEGLADAFKLLRPDIVVILGDRYEALAAAAAAVVFNIPVAHLHGGETTEGAIDDKFRHAITQLSTYHFASTPQYADKIISMGAPRDKVFHSGAPGAEVKNEFNDEETFRLLSNEFQKKTGIAHDSPFILLAFHPVTLLPDQGILELKSTLQALDLFIKEGYMILVTMPNSDPGNESVRQIILEWANQAKGSVKTVASLGSKLFHYALENAVAIVGNSSAALIEAPSHRLGSVNVGIRQKGRAHGISVIDVQPETEEIVKALNTVMSLEMKAVLLGQPVSALNPYYRENSSGYIASILINLR